MDWSYATIPIEYEGYDTLYNEPGIKNHVEYPNNEDAFTDHEFDALIEYHENDHCYIFSEDPIDPHFDPNLSQDLVVLPFVKKYSINDVIWPKREYYQEKLENYKEKELVSLTILNQGNEEK